MIADTSGADVDLTLVRILEKSCQNCHSLRTEWPWYSYVAPMSWLIENDVHEEAMVQTAATKFGRIDILINNVGILPRCCLG